MTSTFRRIILCLITAAVILSLSACGQLGYYMQAAKGQFQLISKRQPITNLLNSPTTSAPLREQLISANEIRGYALMRLGLEGNKGFSYYTDLGRRYVLWNVVAAPKYSIEPKTWCFPIAGCVAYKGYFNESGAEQERLELIDQDYDVLVYGVTAYSTLGWFSDPLLNTFINYPEIDLASLIFHELTHQILYIQDDSEFNEAFATAVELVLLKDWLQLKGDSESLSTVELERSRHNVISGMVFDYREKLDHAYKKSVNDIEKAKKKKQLFGEMKSAYSALKKAGQGTRYYDWWFSRELGNADLLTVSTYYRLVPAFTKMIEQHETLSEFFEDAITLSEMKKPLRDIRFDKLLGDSKSDFQ